MNIHCEEPKTASDDLHGTRVLLTRTAEDNEELRPALEQLGASVYSLPCIAIAPPDDPEPLVKALSGLSSFDWVAFTSRNSVRAVFSELGGAVFPSSLKVAAVGPGTARELEAHGIPVDLRFRTASATALADAMQKQGMEGKRVLLPIGEIARRELSEKLSQAGARVDSVTAYRTTKPLDLDPQLIEMARSGSFDVVVVASPSAINNLVEMLGGVEGLIDSRIAAIGETTARAVEWQGLTVDAIATEASPAGLVGAVVVAHEVADGE